VRVLAGSGLVFYLVVTVQTAINAGITIGSILIAGDCLQVNIWNNFLKLIDTSSIWHPFVFCVRHGTDMWHTSTRDKIQCCRRKKSWQKSKLKQNVVEKQNAYQAELSLSN
jgi:hypothetical protein